MKMKKTISGDQTGSALLFFVLVVPYLILITAHFMQFAVTSYGLAKKDQFRTHAQLAADAGIDYAIQQVNSDPLWGGTGSFVDLHNDGKTCTRYHVTVSPSGTNNKILVATGIAFSPVGSACGSTAPRASVTINVELRGVQSGNFSIVTGVGGLFLSNNAKVLGGDVFVNGELELKNSAQIGLVASPVNLQVAHQNCPNPPNSTYPRVCNSGENGQPISILNSAHIYGEVRANNQTSGSSMSNPGLVASSGVTPQPLPVHNRDAQKTAVLPGNVDPDGFSCNSGTHIWPANYKIVGDVTISNTCSVTIAGDVWITGKFEMKNSARIVVSDLLGVIRPTIMVDGPTAKLSNAATLVSNLSNTGTQLITYWSNTSCSPDCADVTGQDLYNSRNTLTLELDNSASGAHSIFYARWTRVLIANSGQLGALVGQTVELKNSGTITFGTSVGGGTTYWVIDGYRRIY